MPARSSDALLAGRPRGEPVRTGLMSGVLAGLLVLTALSPAMSAGGGALTGEGSPLRQGLYIALLLLAVIAVRPFDNPRRLLVVPVAIVAALGWCWISLAWSVAPDIGLRRLILTTIIVWTVFITADNLGYERSIPIVRVVLVGILIVNYLVVLGWPEMGIHQSDEVYDKALVGDWRGMEEHKNFAGALCALTVIAFLFDARRMPRWLQMGVVAAAALFLVMSQSRTSLGVCVLSVLLGLVFQHYHARYRFAVMGVLCVAALVASLYLNVFNDIFLRNLNDDTAFTGRTQIWRALLAYAGDHPLTGAGYGSFWNVGPTSPIFSYSKGWVTTISAGHNGFLDLATTIGWPGLVIVLVAVAIWPLARLFTHPVAGGARGGLLLASLIFCVAHNFTETTLFDRDAIGQVFLMLSIGLLWRLTTPVGRLITDGRTRPSQRRRSAVA